MAYYHSTKSTLKPGELIETATLTADLDAACWEAELAPGDGPGRIYEVEPTGPVEHDPHPPDKKYPGPSRTYHTSSPVRVTQVCTDAAGRPHRLYHGTKADVKPGDLIGPGHRANFGKAERVATHIYLAGTLEAAIWGAELARGDGPGRIYVVEPTGELMDDPNLTNKRFPGNPTKSYRSRKPLRVTGEVREWQGHSPEALQAMRDGLERLGDETIDD